MIFCSCLVIKKDVIEALIKEGKTPKQIQELTQCGTDCGSCLLSLKKLTKVIKEDTDK